MRVEELSIGDFLFFTDGDCAVRVEEIYNDAQLLISDGDSISEPVHLTHLHPIPLTPEILEKNGFCPPPKHCGYYRLTVGNEEVFVCIDNGFSEFSHYSKGFVSDEEYINKLEISHSMFVHELQHALRLAGIDKEIEI